MRFAILGLFLAALPMNAADRTPVLIDTDIGSDIDDAFALALAYDNLRIAVRDDGTTVADEGEPNARVATAVQADEFLRWYVDRVRGVGRETLPAAPKNPTKLIEPGGFPARVHAFEDYDSDIEKRWWMCGTLETKDVPVRGGRACRAVLTQDFDDRQGQREAMYRAVIVNPVPGPPMGPNTRLRFKYKLRGTDTLRIQLYSLSNGYHRYLSVSGLPEGRWREGCVDMTRMRRPDGTGGPLAADERIDDIPFYVGPRADLLIDDIVLYDAAPPGETRPFPKRILFTGWFDTGKQGVEWPGEFEIVPHDKPRTWKAARSVPTADGREWLRVGLRGTRRLGAHTALTFKYHVTGKDAVRVELRDATGIRGKPVTWVPAKANEWAETTLIFPQTGVAADEIRFVLPKGSRLMIDDLLLYEPGDWPD